MSAHAQLDSKGYTVKVTILQIVLMANNSRYVVLGG